MLKIHKLFLDFFFPKKCFGCNNTKSFLCINCVSSIPKSTLNIDKNTYALFSYKNPLIKKVLWHFKYRGHSILAEELASLLYELILEEISDERLLNDFINPIFIPIPISRKRLRVRGFNQSELIAKNVVKLNKKDFSLVTNVLYKLKDTPNQMSIKDKDKRLKNLKDCFSIKDTSAVYNKNIVLIDDITTTGATINEARNVLMQAGARQIIAFTIAH